MDLVLTILSYVFWVGLALGILVFIHELGHFLAAKLFGMRVERFSIGFPPRVVSKTVGETEYQVGAIPLGGYVKISGMIDESMDADYAHREPEPWEFRSKPVWQRIVVITAGVIFNFVLAFAIFIGLKWAYGESYIPAENVRAVYVAEGSVASAVGIQTGDRLLAVNGRELERFGDFEDVAELTADEVTFTVERGGEAVVLTAPDDLLSRLNQPDAQWGLSPLPPLVGAVAGGGPAAEAGLRSGDRIVALDGEPVQFWGELVDALQDASGEPVAVRFVRPDSLAAEEMDLEPVGRTRVGAVYEVTVTPERRDGRYLLGVHSASGPQLEALYGIEYERYGFGEAVVAGSAETVEWIALYGRLIKRLFTGQDDVRESVGGPVMIAQATKQAADAGMRQFWFMVAMLSIALAVFNILPIPALDGGHLVFLLYEGVTRREPSVRVRMIVQQVGFVLLLAFMAFVIFNDITRL
ncbi:MAG: RIP metalloprotease RseP [Rhodothermales bacterium]|nr:RIP metalloprotease RseP [Rhodothermales bacterium]